MRILFFIFLNLSLMYCGDFRLKALEAIPYDKNLAQIGKKLYFDTNISSRKMSCIYCHNLDIDGSGTNDSGVNKDNLINPPTVLNAAYSYLFFKDGAQRNLKEQIIRTLKEDMGVDKEWIENNIINDNKYTHLFSSYGFKLDYDNFINSLVEFEKALVTLNAPFDKYLKGDDKAISDEAKIGYALFKYYGCNTCHSGFNFGTNIKAKINTVFSPLCDILPENVKVPTLRNITLSAPYGYSGVFNNLEDMVKIMAVCQVGVILEDSEVENILAFLKSLEGQRPEILDKR
ncbi:cytochrome-c peroxidase [Campylobacter canadensis]|uniref:cytochrome-c peroxidase n=1 Tax=Campylobacter canadensis TaxID=449520 RepID=UPI001CCBF15B|nr:cytochrome c peroxidase [Campylobacter canadensis]MBZ7993938.1 c-type cytochrome [Campylobacter canadensis]